MHYFDTLIAKAQCTDMEGEKLHFTLWEDDALKEGHNKINEINKINPIPISATVKRGKAEARFNMAFYTQASMIANMQLAKGDKSEGKNHEYYVTADYYGKLEASNNVNIVNPEFSNPIQKSIDLKYSDKKPQKPKVNKRPTPPPPAPNKDTYKTPITPKAKTKAPDPKGKILSVEFVDFLGKPYQNVKFGTQVKAKIISKDMKGKTIKLKIWEDDISDQLVYENNYILGGDESYATLNLTNEMRKKGDDFKEGSEQKYFLEIEYAGQSVDSEVINVNDSAPKIKVETGVSTSGVKAKKIDTKNCGGKFCIKKGDKNELIREINIRLAGFGGNVPTDEFTDRTEKMIKQFQRDYMKVAETGKICGNVLKAIDEFCNKWIEKITDYKCLCHASDSKVEYAERCPGYGKGKTNEHPGIHRSLLWGVSCLKFYLTQQNSYKYRKTSAGYRCWAHNKSIPRTSTNHMGKAIDMQFNEGSYEISGKTELNLKPLKNIRDKFYIKYLKAEEGWSIPSKKNNYRLEPIGTGKDQSYSWIHMDVALFENNYLKDIYFTKEQNLILGKSISNLANELGYKDMCSCSGDYSSSKQETTEEKKKKWSHTEFANLIAQEESNDNYNICNQTKGGLKIINNVKVVEITIKEIQKKQVDRDVFAVGRYQLIPDTLSSAIVSLKLETNEKLNNEMQDKIFDEYLIKVKRAPVIAYLEGNGNVEDAMYSLAQEWASIGVEKGKRISDKVVKKDGKVVSRITRYAKGGESYYAGDGLNKSHITPEQIKNALINSKNANK